MLKSPNKLQLQALVVEYRRCAGEDVPAREVRTVSWITSDALERRGLVECSRLRAWIRWITPNGCAAIGLPEPPRCVCGHFAGTHNKVPGGVCFGDTPEGRECDCAQFTPAGADLTGSQPVTFEPKTCSCGRTHATSQAWQALRFIGLMDDGHEVLELRHCPCGSTNTITIARHSPSTAALFEPNKT
jgi:hypothetical protein